MGRLGIPLWWGPGRHGPGNNLFFMIEDPDGHKVEFSAELELMPKEKPYRIWPHEQRTLNLWGSAWMRSWRSSAPGAHPARAPEVERALLVRPDAVRLVLGHQLERDGD